MRTIEIRPGRPGPGPCPVHLGPDATHRLLADLAGAGHARTVLVSDHRVAALHAEDLRRRAVAAGLDLELLTFPAGERHKTREAKAALEDRLLELQVGRDGAVVALGGGVTGDLAGFLAGTWHRGIPVYQVPTSLMAMVDAAIGGKTAVDLPGAKNQVGLFHQPAGIYIDPGYLRTLPGEAFRSGLAEVVKYGVIADCGILERLSGDLASDPDRLEGMLWSCIRIKARVVEEDPLESGRRAILNFGHTVAHALEAATGFAGDHGRAVAVGMMVEGRLAMGRTGFPGEDLERLRQVLQVAGLPVRPPEDLDPARVVQAAVLDKKNRGGSIRCALPVRLGAMPPGRDPTVEVTAEELAAALVAD